jgi:hypothetical protein
VTEDGKTVVFAIDPGFAQVKFSINGKTGCMPAAVAEPLPSMEGVGKGQRVHHMDFGSFVVGADALEPGSRQIQSLDEDWLLKYLPLMVVGAADCAKVNPHEVDILTVCLPPKTWRAVKPQLEKDLSVIRDNGDEYRFERVIVHAQAMGAVGWHSSTCDNPEERGILLDVGGNTILALRYDNLMPKSTGSRQYNELGVLSAAQSLMPILSSMSEGRRVTEIKAMAAIRERKYVGKDIGAQVDAVIATYSERILRSIRSDYRDMIPELDRLVVVGGGAYLVGEAIKKEYGPHVLVPPEPEYCNVRGIEWLAKLSEGRQ